jgi:AraC-like DNA-binding protein
MTRKTTQASLLQREFGLRSWSGAPALMTRSHRHNDLELNIAQQGGVTYVFAGRRVRLEAGQAMLFWAASPHQLTERDPGTHMHWLTFPLGWLLRQQLPKELVKPLLRGDVLRTPSRPQDCDAMVQWQTDLRAGGQWPVVVLLELEARLRRFAAAAQPLRASNGRRTLPAGKAEQIAQLLSEHFAEPVRIDALARQVHLHPNYAMQVFRESFGVSIVEYLTQQRVAHAQQLLASSNLSVLTIALRSGFGSSSQFYEAFKRICGMTPLAYRRMLLS